ncbi:MAG: RagB/SusD family nutrient uptake outer membrane protein [Cyclobacteriaceae bacterium]
MKNIKYIIILAVMIGCSNDLEEQVYSNVSPSNFYKNAADGDAAVSAIYNALNRAVSLWDFGLTSTVATMHPYFIGRVGWRNHWADYTVSSGDGLGLPRSWNPLYQAIFRANVAISELSTRTFEGSEEVTRGYLIAEAQWLRAWSYFHLTQLFGNVPMPLVPAQSIETANLPATPREAIYAQIISDLQDAEANLPTIRTIPAELGRPNVGTAKFLLAKVYLTMAGAQVNDASKMALAHSKIKEVIDNASAYGYELLPSYADAIYIDNNSERVWAIQQTQAVEGQGTAGTFVWAGIGSTNGGVPRGQAHGGWTQEFYDLYESGDTRRDVTMQYSYIHSDTGEETFFSGQPVADYDGDPYKQTWGIPNNKYKDSDQGCCDGDPDIIYYRYSDALLMYAEAENSLNGPTATAYEYLNMVRERGGASALTPGSHTKEEFAELMFTERLLEFTFECQELYDIRRLGKVQEIIESAPLPVKEGTVYKAAFEVWPIPNTEVNANAELEQNPGW